jgi:hyperosmotically inducible protein
MKRYLSICWIFALLVATGCGPAIIAGGATGGYKTATDERTVGRVLDDATITTKINAELVKDPVAKARRIDVDTLDGVVTLTGVVETSEEAKRAGEIAMRVAGVKKVKNNLQIGSKTWGQALDDKVIGSKIKAKLVSEPGIRSLNIDVDVNKGVVTLTGIVKFKYQKDRAIEIARTTSGTVSVVDNIRVKNP